MLFRKILPKSEIKVSQIVDRNGGTNTVNKYNVNKYNERNHQHTHHDDPDDIMFGNRKLDTFAESLLHVNRIFNKMYGFKLRKVPAHMPHLIDKSIMSELQSRYVLC